MKTVKQVAAALGERYDGPTQDKDGFTYIPWPEVVRKLDEVFGPTSWSVEPVSFTANPAKGLYTAAVKLSARAYDEDTKTVVEFSRAGFSTSTAGATKREQEQGLTVTENLKLHETAADGAGSLALVKASKQLGDAFGLYLYNKDEQRSNGASRSNGAPARTGGNGGGAKRSGPTAKQVEWLIKKGVVASEDEALEMSFEEASTALDKAFGNGGGGSPAKAKAQSTARRTGTPDDEELPF